MFSPVCAYKQDSVPVQPPPKTKEDVLLFFKLYNPEKEELRLVFSLDNY
jgi:hypothetical protein